MSFLKEQEKVINESTIFFYNFLQSQQKVCSESAPVYQLSKSYLFTIIIISSMLSVRDEEIASLGWKSIKTPEILCGSGNRISQICINKDCLFEAFMCPEDQCISCQPKNHPDCYFMKFSQLTSKAQGNLNSKVKILRSIFQIQEKLMKQLRQSREKLISERQQQTNIKLQNLIRLIFQKKDIKGLKGANMSQLFSQITPPKQQQDKLEKQLNRLKEEGEKSLKEMIVRRQQILDSLLEKESPKIDSKILEKSQGEYLLRQLNNPTKLQLLFRASQHNFAVSKFHECCDGISDTVTIVRTEFGKTIAAYTPLQWSSPQKGKWVADDSLSSFLLQLELKQKMTLTQPQYAIGNNKNYGPIFGRGKDLCIEDKSNQNQLSRSKFPFSYNCNGKYQKNQSTYTAFCGNPNGRKFRIAEWQVFIVVK